MISSGNFDIVTVLCKNEVDQSTLSLSFLG